MFDLEAFEKKLSNQVQGKNFSEKTKAYYVACLNRINKTTENRPQTAETIAHAIDSICQGNKQGTKYIAAVKKYERDVLDAPKSLLYGEALQKLREKHKPGTSGVEPALPENKYLKKINRLNNEKLKFALRLQDKSGLRISEIAKLSKEDFTFTEDHAIRLNVMGKGRKARTVDVLPDEYLFRRLKRHFEALPEGEMPFYSESYLKKKAGELGIKTHDLRRKNARERFRNQREEGASRRAARREAQVQLGHEKPDTTNVYLGSAWTKKEGGQDED